MYAINFIKDAFPESVHVYGIKAQNMLPDYKNMCAPYMYITYTVFPLCILV